MDANRKTLIRLSEDARLGFARVSAKGNFNKNQGKGNIPPQFGGEEDGGGGGGQQFQKGGFGQPGQGPSTAKRQIPDDHEFDKKAIKPIVKTLWAMSVALGHALTAHRQFSRLKSSTFSPDGQLGGRGYVMPIKEIRQQIFEACENLSTLVDTLHDEINAPHWKPKLGELEKTDMAEVERLLSDAEEWVDNPEEEAEEEEKGLSSENAKWTKERMKDDKHAPRSDVPGGGDKETVQKSGPSPGSPEHPQNKQMKQASTYDRRTVVEEPRPVVQASGPAMVVYQRFVAAQDPVATGLHVRPFIMWVEDVIRAGGGHGQHAEEFRSPEWRKRFRLWYDSGETVEGGAEMLRKWPWPKPDPTPTGADLRKLRERMQQHHANSSVDPGTLPGPRVDHLDRADVDQTGPGGSYNREDPPVSDEWGETDGVSGEPMSQNTGDSYAYPSAFEGELNNRDAAGDVYNPHAILPNDPDRALGDRAKGEHTTTIEDEDQEWRAASAVWGSSGVPDSNSDSTPTEGYDFGIGDGNGNDAHGQGAGGYGVSNPGSPDSNPDSGVGNRGVFGPQAELPNDPGGSTRDRENSDTVPKIEEGIGNSSVPTQKAAVYTYQMLDDRQAVGKIPNDGEDPVARSDYYWGDKGNDFNTDKNRAASPEEAESRQPGNYAPQPPAPSTARPSHLGEWEFSAAPPADPLATSGMPGDNPGGTYDSAPGYSPDEYHRTEQVDEPYIAFDDTTHNMKPDETYQRGDLPAPYVNQTTP